MNDVRCPGCCGALPPDRLVPGTRFGCDFCAGLVLELVGEPTDRGIREVPFASCPDCETPLEVPCDAAPGDTMHHCGRALRLAFEFGAWALLKGDGE